VRELFGGPSGFFQDRCAHDKSLAPNYCTVLETTTFGNSKNFFFCVRMVMSRDRPCLHHLFVADFAIGDEIRVSRLGTFV